LLYTEPTKAQPARRLSARTLGEMKRPCFKRGELL
jgi:hypothetical protein